VGGAAVGNELADGLGDGDGDGFGDSEAVAEEETVAVPDALAEGLVLAVGVAPLLAVPVTTALAVADPVTEGEKMAGVVEDEGPEQAESATEASTVKAPQPAAVSLALSTVPAMVVRTFMEPPRGPGRRRPCFRIRRQETFPDPGRRNRRRKGNTVVATEPGRSVRRQVC